MKAHLCCWLLLAAAAISAELSDEQKLERILNGKNDFTRAHRMRNFAGEGRIDAVGQLVNIGGKVYFKTTDQSYISEGKRFPYPELFFEVHLSEEYAYRPLAAAGLVKQRIAIHPGPIRVQGNWAYERPYHIFGLVWVDAVKKVQP